MESFGLGPVCAWCCLTVGITLISCMEAVGVAALFFSLLPEPAAAILTALVLLPSLGLIAVMISALRGRILVDRTALILRFGLLGGTVVPRSLITRVERYDPAVALSPIGLGIDHPTGSGRVTVTRGGPAEFVRVTLRGPARIRLAVWRHAVAGELVLSVSRPDALVDSLR